MISAQTGKEMMSKQTVEDRSSIDKWHGPQDIGDAGMLVQIKRGVQAGIQYNGDYAKFRVNPDPASSEYTASRISEIDSRLEVAQRVKRWRPTEDMNVTGKFKIRFSDEQTTLTYNLMLWNAPFKKERGIPAMSIGVTRSVVSDFEYAVVIAQNVVVNPQASCFGGDVLRVVKLRETSDWLRMTEWHWVHILFAEDWARVEVQQGDKRRVVVEEGLTKPVEALGFVFSVDNEVLPGRYQPVSAREPEGFDMGYFEVGYIVSGNPTTLMSTRTS